MKSVIELFRAVEDLLVQIVLVAVVPDPPPFLGDTVRMLKRNGMAPPGLESPWGFKTSQR
jgi:hypothetical protein